MRTLLTCAAALGGLLVLGGCGFTPMYADGLLTQSLSGVAVDAPPHSRTGYLMAQAIDDELGRTRSAPPRYIVHLELKETRGPRGVRVNNVAGRYEINLVTTYTLEDAGTGTIVTSGSFVTQTSYDSADAPYAGLAASQEGQERAAQQAAVRLRLELARFMAGHPYHEAPTAAGRQERYRSRAGAEPLSSATDSLETPRDDLAAEPGAGPATATPTSPQSPPPAPRDPI